MSEYVNNLQYKNSNVDLDLPVINATDLSSLPFFCFQKVTSAPPACACTLRSDQVHRFRQTSHTLIAGLAFVYSLSCRGEQVQLKTAAWKPSPQRGAFWVRKCRTTWGEDSLSIWPWAHRRPRSTPATPDHFTVPVNTSTVTAFVYGDKGCRGTHYEWSVDDSVCVYRLTIGKETKLIRMQFFLRFWFYYHMTQLGFFFLVLLLYIVSEVALKVLKSFHKPVAFSVISHNQASRSAVVRNK